jgi:hypothetical protein
MCVGRDVYHGTVPTHGHGETLELWLDEDDLPSIVVMVYGCQGTEFQWRPISFGVNDEGNLRFGPTGCEGHRYRVVVVR